jgi:hypothetical protein
MRRPKDICSIKAGALGFDYMHGCLKVIPGYSKNNQDGKKTNEHKLLLSNNPVVCAVFTLALYFAARKLVNDGGRSQDVEGLLFSHVKKKKNKKGQEVIVYQSTSDPILKMLKTCAFRGTLGVYSLRKCGSTLLADNGFQRDAINYRGGWSQHKQVRTIYYIMYYFLVSNY